MSDASNRPVSHSAGFSPGSPELATPEGHYREAMMATAVGLIVNFAVGLVKLVGGIFGQSFALIADAINSLGDTVASVVTIAALWFAR
jgi:divalent metal cation (Fe/Co/Zn/Cd) transporter